MKSFIVNILNRALTPFGARVISESEKKNIDKLNAGKGNPNASILRERLFKQLVLKGFYPAHIIDVGAHKGYWSIDAQKVFPECRFTLIEPQIEMKPYLDKFCSGSKNSRWIVAGAGAEEGELPFTIAPNSDGSSFAVSEESAKRSNNERRMLPVVTLDSVCEKYSLPVPDIVKIDAEGLDLEVVKGAKNLIGKTELFFLEIPLFDYWPNQSFHIITDFMRVQGYEPYDITDINRRISDGALALMEVAFAKRKGKLRDHHGW